MRHWWYAVLASGFIYSTILPDAAPVEAGEVNMSPLGGTFSVPVVSAKEARYRTIIKQRYDYSCGSAAVASLLTHHYDRLTTEEEVFQSMFDAGDQETIKKKGFSLLDMKNYLESRGLQADGFRISLDKLAEVGVPAIVLIEIKGYRHFVLVKGIRGAEVVVGDPALGGKVYKREAFEKLRVGDIVFVIRSERKLAQANFNREEDWAVRPAAPLGSAIKREGLSGFTLMLPGRNEF